MAEAGPLWPAGSSSDEGTGQQERQGCQEPCRCHLCPPQRGPPPEPAPLRMLVFLLGAHGGGTCRVSGASEGGSSCPEHSACAATRDTWPQLIPGAPAGAVLWGCLPLPVPHRLPVADQDPSPT